MSNALLSHLKTQVLAGVPSSPAEQLVRVYVKPDDLVTVATEPDITAPFSIIKLQPLRQYEPKRLGGCLKYRTVAEIYIYVANGVPAFGTREDSINDQKSEAYAAMLVDMMDDGARFNDTAYLASETVMQLEVNVPFEWNGDPYTIVYAAFDVTVDV